MEVSRQLRNPAAWPPGKSQRYPLDRRLVGLYRQSGRYKKRENLVPDGDRTPVVKFVVRRYTDRATEAII
jgi:hypothetical protein